MFVKHASCRRGFYVGYNFCPPLPCHPMHHGPGFPLIGALLALSMFAAACGSSGDSGALPGDTFILMTSSDLAVGRQRVAIGALDAENNSVASPEVGVRIEMFLPDGSPAGAADAEFIWAIEDVRGLYVAEFDFDVSGAWTASIVDEAENRFVAPPFNVAEDAIAIDIGEAAPQSESKTLDDGALAEITTDTNPDPSFYEMTVAEAVTSSRPSVIVFATPAFCVSATCGPSLDTVKAATSDFPDVNFLHVEVYDNLDAASFDELVLAEPILEWGLPTEPWVYVVDADGTVSARFEGAIGDSELRAALAAVQG